jgi:hypothetical protein
MDAFRYQVRACQESCVGVVQAMRTIREVLPCPMDMSD